MREIVGFCGLLTVLNRINFKHSERIFNWVVDNNISHIDYQLCAKQRNQEGRDLTLSDDEAGKTLTGLFDLWFAHDDANIHVRIFEDAIRGILGGQPRVCSWKNGCGAYLSFDSAGNVFVCARYHVYPETFFGNIMRDKFEDIIEKRYRGDMQSKIENGQKLCAECSWKAACGGGCPLLKYATYGHFDSLYPFCVPRKHLFEHIAKIIA